MMMVFLNYGPDHLVLPEESGPALCPTSV